MFGLITQCKAINKCFNINLGKLRIMKINLEDLQGIWKLQTGNPDLISTMTFKGHFFSKITVEDRSLTDDCDYGIMELRNMDKETTDIFLHPKDILTVIALINVNLENNILAYTLKGITQTFIKI